MLHVPDSLIEHARNMLNSFEPMIDRAQATFDAFAPAHERSRPEARPKPKTGRPAFEALFSDPPGGMQVTIRRILVGIILIPVNP